MKIEELLEARRADNSMPGSRSDGSKIGLVIEGGGMRGVISGAMTAALENLGFSRVFDAVYGASAGAMAAAFFVSGNARAGATIYYEEINNRRFVDLLRFFSSKPVLDLDFLVNEIFDGLVPLDFDRILSSEIELCVVATEVSKAKKTLLSNFSTKEQVLKALKASASNPLITGAPVEIEGKQYWDAILSESIPVGSALEDGCTHIVVLRSRPALEVRSSTGTVEKLLARWIMRGYGGAAIEAYCTNDQAYERELQAISELGEKCLMIAPSPGKMVSQTSRNRVELMGAARDGYQNVLDLLDSNSSIISSMIGHYRR